MIKCPKCGKPLIKSLKVGEGYCFEHGYPSKYPDPPDIKHDHIGNLQSEAVLGDTYSIKQLIDMLKLPDKYNTHRVSDALTNSVRYSSPFLIESYIHEIKNKDIYGYRLKLLKILNDTCGKWVKEDILKLLHHLSTIPSYDELTQIIDILEKIRVPEAVRPLVVLFESSDLPEIRKKIINILSSIGNEKANENLINFLELSKSESESIFLIEKVVKISNSNSIISIVNCLKKNSINIRFQAIRALGDIGDSKTINVLINHLKRKVTCDEEIAIIRAIGKINGKIAIDYLINRVNDQPPTLQIAVIETLGSIDDSNEGEQIKRTFTNLIDANCKNDKFVRMVLSNIKSRELRNYVDSYRQEKKHKTEVKKHIEELIEDRNKRPANRRWNHSNIPRDRSLDKFLSKLKPDEITKIIESHKEDLKGTDRLLCLRTIELFKKIRNRSTREMLNSLKNHQDLEIRQRVNKRY